MCGLLLEVEAQISAGQRAEIREKWLDFEAQRSEKARLYTSLLANIGYGGLIHNFKNYLLRKQPNYANGARNDIGAVRAIIAQYLTVQTEPDELVALHDLGDALAEYQKALNEVDFLLTDVRTDAASLNAAVDVDDTRARQALITLGRIVTTEIGSVQEIGKPRLAAELRRSMGFGGFIHAFKDFVLSNDRRDLSNARQGIATAAQLIREWRTFPINQAETHALTDLEATLVLYENNLTQAQRMREDGATAEEIDVAVKVDDYPATRGLAVLDREIALKIAADFEVVQEQFAFTAQLAEIRDWSSRGVIVVMITFSGLLLFFMIIRPIKRIEEVMSRLAAGELWIDIPGTEMNNEVGRMARAIGVFKETSLRLRESKEELEVTVSELTDSQTRIEAQAAELAEMADNLEIERQRVEKLSVTDRLTGLFNRQKLDDVLETEVARAKRYSHPLSIILFDIDHFKSVNDQHGHLVGDRVLVKMAEIMQGSVRSVDIAGRWGGEEFVVICPETDKAGANGLAEKIRASIEKTAFPVVGAKTASFGVAEFGPDETITSAIHRADEALYAAKNLGRNRIELAA